MPALVNRFIPHSVKLTTGPTWINQIEDTSMEGGVELLEESAGSEIDREFVAAKAIHPVMPFSTSDLSVLTTIGISGLSLISTGQQLVAYGRQLPLGAVPAAVASTVHLMMSCTDGLIVPMGVEAANGAVAKLSLMLHGILGQNGGAGATPFVFSTGNAITTGAGTVANVYTTGPVKYAISGGASRLVQGIENLGCQFAIQVLKEGTDGDVYPTHISIIARMTKMGFTTKDAALIAEVGDGISVSSFAGFFRQVSPNGQRVAPATATHVSVTGTAGMVTPGALNLAHKRPGTASFTFTPAKNTNLISISATAAIPTT